MQQSQAVKVWDPLIRIFHWSLVAAFTISYLTADEESALHTWSGYAVLALVVFRVLWGFIGTRHGRFSDFIYPPSVILAYTRDAVFGRAKRYLGHNPLGGVMVVFMLASLLATGLTGLVLQPQTEEAALARAGKAVALIASAYADRDREEHDDDRAHDRGAGEAGEALEEMHELFANLTLLLVFIHIGGVIVGSLLHRENLVRAMLTGRKYA
jgi:cytochrome b